MEFVLVLLVVVFGICFSVLLGRARERIRDLQKRVEFLENLGRHHTVRLHSVESRLEAGVTGVKPPLTAPRPAEPAPVQPPAPEPSVAPIPAAPAPAAPAVHREVPASAAPRPSAPSSTRPPVAGRPAFDWEGLVGVKLFSGIVGIALVLAAVFFLRYSISAGWLQPPVQMAIGLLVGAGLLAVCELRAARNYPVTANALDASAVAILFATFFAAYARWHFVGAASAFVLLACVTIIAVVLSVRRNSMFIAMLGLLGGFSTPALLSTGENSPVTLFGYLLLLNAGLSWVAYRKRWPVLTMISLILTTVYQWGWVIKFLTAGQLPLSVGIFLVFPILGVSAYVLNARRGDAATPFSRTVNAGAVLPLAFALYMATVPAYGPHTGILFGFLFCLVAGLFAMTLMIRADALHGLGALVTLIVFAVWTSRSGDSATPGTMLLIALFVAFFLTGPLIARRLKRPLAGIAEAARLAAPLLFFTFAALAWGPAGENPALLFAFLFILLAAVLAVSLVMNDGLLYLTGAAFAIAAEAVWAYRHFDLADGLPVFVIFGLLYILVPALSQRLRKTLEPLPEAGAFLGIAGHLLLIPITCNRSLAVPPWGFWTVLAIFDAAILAVSLYRRKGYLLTNAVALSALMLTIWVLTTSVSPWPVLAIVAAGVLAAFGISGLLLARRAGITGSDFALAAVAGLAGAQLTTIASAEMPGSPGVGFLAVANFVFVAALLAVSWSMRWHFLAPAAVIPAAVACGLWQAGHDTPEYWAQGLAFSACLYAAFVAFPLVLGRRAGRLLEPYLAAVLASAAFFFLARTDMLSGGLQYMIGVLPMAQAAVMAVLLLMLLRMEHVAVREPGRLALVAGALFAFVTVAIPLQLEKQWITIGWALEATALAWLYARIPHRGLLFASTGLAAAAFVRLALNPEVFLYAPRGSYPVWNWYLYAYLVSAAALIVAGWFLSRTPNTLAGRRVRASSLLPAAGVVLLFYVVNIEIADFFSTGKTITFNFSASIAQDLTYTLGWAVFALLLLGAGIGIGIRPARIAAILLLAATVLKCFLHDLGNLGGLYRVGSLLGLAICLAAVALLLQKFVVKRTQV